MANVGAGLRRHDDRDQDRLDGLDRVVPGIGKIRIAAVRFCPRHGQLVARGVLGTRRHLEGGRRGRVHPGVRVGDARPRRRVDGTATTVAGLAADEALRPMPTAPFPAILSADAQISAQALVCFRGNSYSVGPGMAGTTVTVVHRLGTATLDIVSAGGVVLARHRRQPDSAGAVIRHDEHVSALEHAVLAAFTDRAPCRASTTPPAESMSRVAVPNRWTTVTVVPAIPGPTE